MSVLVRSLQSGWKNPMSMLINQISLQEKVAAWELCSGYELWTVLSIKPSPGAVRAKCWL